MPGSPQQLAIWRALRNEAHHIIVEALAGTGKTWTIIEGLKSMLGAYHKRACVVTFARDNAKDAKSRLGYASSFTDAMTLHGMGYRILKDNGLPPKLDIERNAVLMDLETRIGPECLNYRENRHWPRGLKYAAARLASICKNEGVHVGPLWSPGQQLTESHLADFDFIEEKHGIVIDGDYSRETLRELTMAALWGSIDRFQQTRDRVKTHAIDFDDQIWLPAELDLYGKPYDLLLVDESQDLNEVQQKMAFRMGTRLVFVGDPNQAIYAFRGADALSMSTIEEHLSTQPAGLEKLPLTVCRRCPKKVIAMAQELVPDIVAMDDAPQGTVGSLSGKTMSANWQKSEMILCRINAPLVKKFYHYLKQDIPAVFKGRDLGEQLIRLVDSFQTKSLTEVALKLADWKSREESRIKLTNRYPDNALQLLDDKAECLITMLENEHDYDTFHKRVEMIANPPMVENGPDTRVQLSSIHRAKGSEARKVSILHPDLMPFYLARTPTELQQEQNLAYVGVTRAMSELYMVDSLSRYFPRTNPPPTYLDPQRNDALPEDSEGADPNDLAWQRSHEAREGHPETPKKKPAKKAKAAPKPPPKKGKR